MASYRGHLAFAGFLGGGYGSLALIRGRWDWDAALIGTSLTALGGLLPDLDSDSSVPMRELFGASAAIVPILIYYHVGALHQLSIEERVVVLASAYVFIRYGLSLIFKHFTVHRGMFHSLPAVPIAGSVAYLLYPSDNVRLRLFVSGAVMLGYFSHLLLDELYGVDFMGVRLSPNKNAGGPLKFVSKSWTATLTTYVLLGLLLWRVWRSGQ